MQGLRDEIIKILNAEMDAAVERAVDRIMETVINQKPETVEQVPGYLQTSSIISDKPVVRIERYMSNADCVIGRVFINGQLSMFSGERADLNNQQNVSCIPVGKYKCSRHVTAKYPESRRAYIINDVPNRSGILFHSGNIPSIDSSGCILLGMSVGKLTHNGKSMDAVLQSRDAMEKFHAIIQNKEFELEIVKV